MNPPREVPAMAAAEKVVEGMGAEAYRARVLALLGGRDPLEVLAETPAILDRLVQANPAGILRARPFPGKWTGNEIIGHLLDSEWTYGFRIRLVLSEERPAIIGIDQDLWVAGHRHNEREPALLAEMFAALRRCTLDLWRRMGPAELERAGLHNERGPETLGLMQRMIAGHDLAHLAQIERTLKAAASGGPGRGC
jgi:hypothetical protein